MTNYLQITIQVQSVNAGEELSAMLSNIGFDGFEESLDGLIINAFISEEFYDEVALNEILAPLHLTFVKKLIPAQNWNALWESNFESVLVDDIINIRAHFHTHNPTTKYEIVITPKMSFGTGHHATTFMCLQLMQELNFNEKDVYDFGSGTGILAIHASQKGAKTVLAVDNDDWCIENSIENIKQNHCENIAIKKVETAFTKSTYDIVIANVNRHIIIENFDELIASLKPQSYLIISGITQEDEDEMVSLFANANLKMLKILNKDNGMWIALLFEKIK